MAREKRRPGKPKTARGTFTYDDLLRALDLIKAAERYAEVNVKVDGMEVRLRRGGGAATAAAPALPLAAAPAPLPLAAASAPIAATPAAEESFPQRAFVIRAPMVGVFYRAPEPGAKPFIEAGQAVEADTVVCLIEVMKLFNSISAGTRGEVTRILADNAQLVEYGQPLMVIEPR
ncbi:MAG: acetyl-CoA carboxylase biotin carboxyl carrier protein [Alphaproteobacteria bacterium]|nr:acetyl-CoA carboxylase biotin carboxyl carrier protein [Alphaproteobacteria bacterium]